MNDQEPALLHVLDGLVRRDGAQSGLRFEVCVGVRRAEDIRWWRARLGPRFACGFIPAVSPTAHVTLLLEENEADAWLQSGQLQHARIEGDRARLEAFIRRYTTKISHLDYRIAITEARRAGQ